MEQTMHQPFLMGHLERLELLFFALAVIVSVPLLTLYLSRYRRAAPAPKPRHKRSRSAWWLCIPEIQLLVLALPLELLWEIAQFPLYTVWHEGDWSYILYGLAHCTLGDLLILLVAYELTALIAGTRYWYLTSALRHGVLFMLAGLAYTIFSETVNVRIKGTWGYTELMPIIPFAEIGGMPFLQWVLIPPLLIALMRLFSASTLSAES